ncbi:TetR/AcrR family transcriptional regulator [Escherichia coli]|nr:TetR/AcrR family transcriptional regulator [Escherichia coli]
MIAVRAGCTRGPYTGISTKKDLLRQVIERVPLSLFDELTAIKNGRVSEPVKAMYRCLSRSLIKLQYNVHLRNVIYIVFFCEECPDDIRINFLQKMVDVNNFVKLLCYIFEKGKLYEKYVRKFVVRLWRSCFFFVYGVVRSCILQPDNKSLFREGCIVLELTQSTFTGIDKNERYYKKQR